MPIRNKGMKYISFVLDYLKNGILIPLYIFISKFVSIIKMLKGNEIIKFYEIVIYFLKLKKFIIENKN